MNTVTLKEIERVFAVLEEFGLSREAVVIPLKPAHPGRVHLRPDNRVEIVFDSDTAPDDWVGVVRERLREILAGPGGDRLKRDDA